MDKGSAPYDPRQRGLPPLESHFCFLWNKRCSWLVIRSPPLQRCCEESTITFFAPTGEKKVKFFKFKL